MSVACSECGEKVAKYRCPGCDLRSCSLDCVQRHKKKSGCTGKRDRTGFVAMAQFDDNQLVSDYNLLEETLRLADTAKRTRYKLGVRGGYLSPPLKNLVWQAQNRGTKLRLMAHGMSKRCCNTTYYDRRQSCIFWRLEWVFHCTDVRLIDERVEEQTILEAVLQKHLGPSSHTASLRHQLQPFVHQQLKLLYRKEPREQGKDLYYDLDAKQPLRSLLASKTVIEFPVIIVVKAAEASSYAVMEGEQVVEAQHRQASVTEEPAMEGKNFREEEIGDQPEEEEDEMNIYDFLEDLPQTAAKLWDDL